MNDRSRSPFVLSNEFESVTSQDVRDMTASEMTVNHKNHVRQTSNQFSIQKVYGQQSE